MNAKPICLVIGAGAGNGLAIARTFGKKGFHLVLASRSKDGRSKLIAELESEGVDANGIDVDCADPGTVSEAVAKLALSRFSCTTPRLSRWRLRRASIRSSSLRT